MSRSQSADSERGKVTNMFITITMLFIVLGVLLLFKARRMQNIRGYIRYVVGAAVLIILGVVLASLLLSGQIVLPLS